MKAYHVTTKRNYNKIKRDGLIPKIGPRSKSLGEEKEGIYLFKSLESAHDALMNWLGYEFDEDEKLVLVEVDIVGIDIETPENSFEIVIYDPISPDRITFISYE